MSKKTWAVVVALGLVVAWFGLRKDDASVAATDTPDELVNRIWIDALPTSAKQKVDVFVMVDEPHLGQFLRTSAYEGEYAVFEWHDRDSGRVEMVMLQTDKKHHVGFKVSSQGCDPFDYCMKVKGAPRGAKKYFSMKDWIVEPGRSLELALLDARDAEQRGDPAGELGAACVTVVDGGRCCARLRRDLCHG